MNVVRSLALRTCRLFPSGNTPGTLFLREVILIVFKLLLNKANVQIKSKHNTGCPTRYGTRHFFNNSYTNEDFAKKFEQEYVRCVGNENKSVCGAPDSCDTEQRSARQPVSLFAA